MKSIEESKSYLTNRKTIDVLRALNSKNTGNYSMAIVSEVDTTYPHVVNIVKRLEDDGYIEREADGRRQLLSLTDKGREVADHYVKTVELINQ
jgi:DNA-binding MarR family transcriptional regulator